MSRSRQKLFGLLLAIICALVVGCRDKPAPVRPIAEAPVLTSDEKVLLALDSYEPMYKVDAQGRVTHLRLIWRHLPKFILAEIGKLTELEGLDLAGTTLTDEGLAQLKDLQKVRSLGLSNTMITDQGLVQLEKLSSLQYVWMSKKSISTGAADKLKEARPDMNLYLH